MSDSPDKAGLAVRSAGTIEKGDDELGALALQVEEARAELDSVRRTVGSTQTVRYDQPEKALAMLATRGQDWLRIQVAVMHYQDVFVRYTMALDRRRQEELDRAADEARRLDRKAQERSEAETRSIKWATWAMVAVTVGQLLQALLRHG